MNKSITISFAGIIVMAIAVFVGYLLGRSSVDIPEPITEIVVKWEKGEIVRDTIKVPVPYEVKVPDSIPVFIPADTAALFAIWQDYYLQRKYDLDFSNDTLGIFKVNALVQQNKLVSATSFIRANIRTVRETKTVYRVPLVQFYGVIGSSVDFRTNKIQFGADLKQKFMIGVSGMKIEDKYGYTIDAGIKF